MTPSADPPRRPLPGRAKVLLAGCLLALLLLALQRLACAPDAAAPLAFSGRSMGTSWSVKLAAAGLTPAERDRVQAAIAARLAEVDQRMSTYRDDSELSRFNRAAAGEPFAASPELLEVFRIAQAVSEASGGAFDVTVGPLVAAWGFGANARTPGSPSAAELAALRARVGFHRIALDLDAGTLTKRSAGVVCDLSAIAKGYGVDQVAVALRSLGYAGFLVEVGGEVRAAGRRADGDAWRVAIERPQSGERGIWDVMELRDGALATSGDYRNFYELPDGRRISHTIDPQTGRPVEHPLASVSVLDAEAVWADAWATALNVLGPDAGYALAEARGLAAYFISHTADGGFRARETPAFTAARGAAPTVPPEGG